MNRTAAHFVLLTSTPPGCCAESSGRAIRKLIAIHRSVESMSKALAMLQKADRDLDRDDRGGGFRGVRRRFRGDREVLRRWLSW